ncbi:MAG: hypothetical protein H6732_04205 [Alphaproteobacteria bacterium]|nr:hypothetical protein [Alphaproteobacteria bacterium]
MRAAPCLLLAACATAPDDGVDADLPARAVLEEVRAIVPGPGLPDGVDPNDANNNLDVIRHDGRVWLAVRTAPTHFASTKTRMLVLSSEDEVTWRSEGELAVGTDLREPQLVPTDDGLWIYMAKLGASAVDFEPGGILRARYEGDGVWSEPEPFGPEGMIAWRIKPLAGRWAMLGYIGGAGIYDASDNELEIQWWASDDGLAWEPAVGASPGVLRGGGSEVDAVILDDGSLVAVIRNEAGDADGHGSKICTAPADALGTWTCSTDPRKYDSPLVFRSGGRVWLVGRRHLANEGRYELEPTTDDLEQQTLLNEVAYWNAPKRCALWTVDPATRTVDHVLDLPSRGDTCFPEALDLGDGHWAIYSYSNDVDGPDWKWNEGQVEPTFVYRYVVALE